VPVPKSIREERGPRRGLLERGCGIALLLLLLGAALLVRRHHAAGQQAVAHDASGEAHQAAAEPAQVAEPLVLATITGTVRVSTGGVVAGAHVCVAAIGGAPLATLICVDASASGVFAIAGLPPGRYELAAEAEGFAPGSATEAPIVAPGEVREGVDILLEAGGARFAGRVLDATGGPIEAARVTASSLSSRRVFAVRTDREGAFHVWVSPGSLAIAVEADGYAPAEASAVAPSSSLVVTLIPGAIVRGHVIDAADAGAVPNTEVRVVADGQWGSLSSGRTAGSNLGVPLVGEVTEDVPDLSSSPRRQLGGPHQIRTRRFPPSGSSAQSGSWIRRPRSGP
jgi:hypothetical protein